MSTLVMYLHVYGRGAVWDFEEHEEQKQSGTRRKEMVETMETDRRIDVQLPTTDRDIDITIQNLIRNCPSFNFPISPLFEH